METGAPRRADQALEALVDPARDLLLECAVRAAVRQLRIGRSERVQKRLDRAISPERPRRARPATAAAVSAPERAAGAEAGPGRRKAGRARSGRRAADRGR